MFHVLRNVLCGGGWANYIISTSNSSATGQEGSTGSDTCVEDRERSLKDMEEDRQSLVLFLLGSLGYELEADRVARVSRNILSSDQIVEGISRFQFRPRMRTRLMYAATVGNLKRLAYICGVGARVNMSMGRVPGEEEDAAHLHDAGETDAGYTALHLAIKNKTHPIVWGSFKRGGRIFPSYSAVANYWRSSGNHIECIRLLLDKGASIDLELPGGGGHTALYLALAEGHADVAHLLCERGDVNKMNALGQTPLMMAAEKGNLALATILCDRGASLDLQDAEGASALYIAAAFGHLEVAHLLCERGAAINSLTAFGRSALFAACRVGMLGIATILCDRGALLDLRDASGDTALTVACENNQLDTVRLLCERGAQLDRPRSDGWTALLLAVLDKKLAIATVLVNRGAALELRCPAGFTALDLACKGDDIESARLLLEVGATIGAHALCAASNSGRLDIVRLLCDKGADVNLQHPDSRTALNFAWEQGHLQVADFLCDRGAIGNIDFQLGGGSSAIMQACELRRLDVVSYLCERGAALNLLRNDGMTALMIACDKGCLTIARHLCEKGAALDLQNTRGVTALYLASASNRLAIVQFLCERGANVNSQTNLDGAPQ